MERHLLIPAALAVLLAGVTCDPAMAQDPFEAGVSAAGPVQPPSAPAGLPAMHSFEIHQDTPPRREDILRQRPVADGRKIPTDVPPLPGQTISPSASEAR
jgi:hypothetical protein